MTTLLRIVLLVWPFLKEIVKNSPAMSMKKGSKFDKTMLIMNIIMFLIFMYITENAFKMATVVETQSDALITLRSENAGLVMQVDRESSLHVVAQEQVELQKQLIRHYALQINNLKEDVSQLTIAIAEKDTLIGTLQITNVDTPINVKVIERADYNSNAGLWLEAIREREAETD